MTAFPIDRTHPPRRIVYQDDARHLVLRPWSFDEVDALRAAIEASRVELREFMPWVHSPLGREGTYELIARFQADYWAGRDYGFGMFGESGEIIGGIGLHPRIPLNPKGLEVGFWCTSDRTGRGWTTLAVRVLVSLAFDWFGCDRLQVSHDEANLKSMRVVEKCGFSYEGTLRQLSARVPDELYEGGFRGTYRHRMYAMVPSDLPGLSWLDEVRSRMTLFDALGAKAS
jgi:RimJ/RimL family protein N-acetyltransferase